MIARRCPYWYFRVPIGASIGPIGPIPRRLKTLRPQLKPCLLPLPMGHNKGSDNVKKRAARRKKTERLALAKIAAATAAK